MRKEKGFTLIELMVVIVIIAILAAVALPNFMGATERARESAVRSAMKTIQTALEMYATENSGTYTADLSGVLQHLPGGKLPNSPATNSPYVIGTNLLQASGNPPAMPTLDTNPTPDKQYAIVYLYNPVENSYTIIGYNRTNTKDILRLSNK